MFTGLINRLTILAICAAVGVAVGLGIAYALGAPVREGQAAAQQLLSTKATLCSDATQLKKVKTSRVKLEGKIAVIHVRDGTLYQPYQDALRPERQPSQNSEVVGMLCLVDAESVYDTDYYGENRTYSCTRYEQDFEAYLVEVESGQVVAYRTIEGPEPDECPDRTDESLTRRGELPSPEDVADWVD